MKRLALAASAFCVLGFAGCGSNHHLSSADKQVASQDTRKAEAIAKRCVPDPVVLKSHAGRTHAAACAAPGPKRHRFYLCLFRGALNGLPSPGRLHNVFVNCVGQVLS